MRLSSISLALTRLGQQLGRWSPLALWPDGIASPGMWIDPSLLTASFNDYTGTTPISTVGTVLDSSNPVGLVLDCKGGLVLGAELVANGDFSNGSTGWTEVGTGWSISGGAASAVNVTGYAAIGQTTPATVAGKFYQCRITVSGYTSGQVHIYDGSAGYSPAMSANGSYSFIIQASGTAGVWVRGNGNFTGTVDNISVREIPGNHMLQSTSAARPLESARVNQFVGTELYANNAANSNGWLGTVGAGTVTPNAMFVGSVALSQVTISASTGNKGAYNSVASPAFPFVVSGFAKADGYRYLQIYGAGTGSLGGLVFDAVAGVFSQNTNSLETSVTAEGGGAFRFSVKSPGGVDSIGFGIIPQDTVTTAYGNQSWAGDGVSGMYLGGFSLVYGDKYTPYQSVPGNGSTYTSTGSTPFQLYDGTDDGMATASFAAGTLINGMDCMIPVRRDSTARMIVGLYNTSGDPTRYFGEATNDVGAFVCFAGVGSPTVWVDGVQLPGGSAVTIGTLYNALTAGVFHILEFRGLNLSTWTQLSYGGYTAWVVNGARGDIMLYPSTTSTTDKDAARQYLADKYGVTLP